MNLNTDVNRLKTGTDRPSHMRQPGHAGKSIQKIAVLFTDIIGSTRFFQSHGNLAGRQMLQQHENIASMAITKFGGTVVKNLGDSILAYFVDPREATKAAVEVQKEFSRYNRRNGGGHKIHVRIGVHFDEGIVEDNDIFGNAVNIASKITGLAGSNQIFISRNVFAQANTIPSIQFEALDMPGQDNDPDGPSVYRVIWEESTEIAPTRMPVLYMRPLLELQTGALAPLWNALIEARALFWSDRVEGEALTDDQSVILTAKRLSVVMDVAADVYTFLRENIKAYDVVPLQIIIDAGPGQGIDRLAREGFRPEWNEFHPGAMFISPSAYELIQEEGLSIENAIPPDPDHRLPFFTIAPHDYQQKEGEILFPYQESLSHGVNPPCFYCGSKKHEVHLCPSKHLTGITDTLNQLGYLSFDQLGTMFHAYLRSPEEIIRETVLVQAESGDQEPSAGIGFYELKQIFQLRFFKTVWDSRSNDWDKVVAAKDKRDGTGELLWLAEDCIRVSNLSRAESLLQTCLEKYPYDYRTYCALGFLNIEKNRISRSEQYLDTALRHAQTVPQKIFILFLLFRLHNLAGNSDSALQKIREIKSIHPYLPEVTYQEILLNFRQGKLDMALTRLMSLIRMNREYYIKALIDPDLAPFNSVIHPALRKLLTETRRKAQQSAYDAEREFASLEQFLVEGDGETEKARALLAKIRNFAPADSYFRYMDICDLGDAVISACRRAKARRKAEFMDTVQIIHKRLGAVLRISIDPRSRLFPVAAYERLKTIQSTFKEIVEAVTYNDFRLFGQMFKECTEILTGLGEIETELRRVKRILDIKAFCLLFCKDSAFILSVILFAGLIILPSVAYYLSTFSPEFNIFTGGNIRSYHKHTLIFGVLGGLAFSFAKSFKTFFGDKT